MKVYKFKLSLKRKSIFLTISLYFVVKFWVKKYLAPSRALAWYGIARMFHLNNIQPFKLQLREEDIKSCFRIYFKNNSRWKLFWAIVTVSFHKLMFLNLNLYKFPPTTHMIADACAQRFSFLFCLLWQSACCQLPAGFYWERLQCLLIVTDTFFFKYNKICFQWRL